MSSQTLEVSRELLVRLFNAADKRRPVDVEDLHELRAALAAPSVQLLDERLKSAGMLSVADLMAGAPLDGFMTHAGVRDIETFGQWVEMKRAEFMRLQARYDLGDKPKDDELYEWVVAHSAVFSEVHVNLKAAVKSALKAEGTRH